MNQLTTDDLSRIIRSMPGKLVNLLKKENIFLGGGCIRAVVAGEEVADYDIFGGSRADLERIAKDYALNMGGRVMTTANAFTVLVPNRIPVQFIHRWTYSGESQPAAIAVAESFDYTICMAVVWFNEHWGSYIHPTFYADLAARRLRYTQPARNEDAGGSILRLFKYIRRGYHASPETLALVVARMLNGIEPDSKFWQAGENERAAVITSLLRAVDPLTLIDGIEAQEEKDEPNAEDNSSPHSPMPPVLGSGF